MKKSLILFAVLAYVCISCTTEYLPKPKGYNRIDLPVAAYVPLPDSFPYYFEYSKHAKLLPDTSWISEKYWVTLFYPTMDAAVQITYKPVTDSVIEQYLGDSYKLTSQHNIKAYAIEEKILELPSGLYASYTELEGQVPTQAQFHIT
ncbi:MAG: gliding motility lipoprotein GldD, partial [Bacteroidota bacterium]